jgi:hypothetical protein
LLFKQGRVKYGTTFTLGGTNLGCGSMYTWCPANKPIELFDWKRLDIYKPTHKCVHVMVTNNVFKDSLNEVACDSERTIQYMCMSKD